jgi:putative peptidoglycan lipid II flippase
MRIVAFGEATGGGVGLLAAGIASLATGLFFYGAFLLLARAHYALGDSRTPALVALGSGLAGAATMAVAGRAVDGSAVVAAIGIGHSVAYALGATVLAVGLSRRTGRPIVPVALPRALLVAAPLGAVAWWIADRLDPQTRGEALVVVALAGLVGGLLYLLGTRGVGGVAALGRDALARVGTSGGPEEADAAAEEA